MEKICVALAWVICVIGACMGHEHMASLPVQIGCAAAMVYTAVFSAVIVAVIVAAEN